MATTRLPLLLALALGAAIAAPAARAQSVPSGSYRDSCGEIHWSGSTLVATCLLRERGAYGRTALPDANRCRGDIFNDNGRLQCRSAQETGRLQRCESLLRQVQHALANMNEAPFPAERQRWMIRVQKITTNGRQLNCPGFGQ